MILSASNVFFAYDEQSVIQDWSSILQSGQVCHLQGYNGSGKSTLLRLFAGILKPFSGNIISKGTIAYVGHQLGLHPDLSIIENLSLGLTDKIDDWVEFLEEAKLSSVEQHLTGILSVGQKQKVALIRMILQKAHIWLMDEPFANLDEAGERWLWTSIDSHISAGGGVVFTAHQRDFSDRGVVVWQMP